MPDRSPSPTQSAARSQTYVVTGGAGFVGSNLCAELTRRLPGSTVMVIDDCLTGSFANLVRAYELRDLGPFGGEFLPASVEEIDFAELIAERRPAAVFHLGAITDTTIDDERVMLEINSDSFGPMLSACVASGTPLVYASSAATYGTPPETALRRPFAVPSAGKPNNVYGFSKWMMECQHRRVSELHPDAHVVGLRYFNVFGPCEEHKGNMASMVYQLCQQMLAGERPRLFADGSQARDQVSVHDVVDCTITAAGLGERPAGEIRPGVYNLGSGEATSFERIAQLLRETLGLDADEFSTDYFDMPEPIRAFYQDYTCADMTETESGLGWRPGRGAEDRIREYGRVMAEQAGRTPAPV